MSHEHTPKLTASVTYVHGDAGDGLVHLAEALVLLQGDLALDDALRLAHNFNTAAVQQHSRRRILDDVASTLRDQLAAVERQMHEAA
jgi:hypothetical protein